MKKPLEIRFLEFLEPDNEIPARVKIHSFINANKESYSQDTIQSIGNKGHVLFYGDWVELAKFEAIITQSGQDYLNEFRVKHILWLTNQSSINTDRAVRISLRFQIGIGIITMAAIGLTAYYDGKNYHKGDSISLKRIDTLLQRQVQQSDSILLLQKERNTYLKIMAKKTSPKKN
jgi:hypothetical protein